MEIKDTEKQIREQEAKEYTIQNPLLYQILTYTAVFIFCCLTILSIIWIITLVKTEGFLSIGGILVITFFTGYSSYLGLQVLRYKTAQVLYNEHCVTVIKRGKTSSYTWSEITKTKYHGMFRVLRLFNAKNENIYTIHGITPDNKKFIQKVGNTIGYTNDVF
ncbi:hypothetical protein [Aquimarina sp. 2201CG14-23]|uniref:hypothetical protein n=1 Tax=Aquimarina mycalae TaxID=3040073 RepID=UPI0024782B6A|nr:hypothetical protein [Aquimarina sp. 2201CG14-23]MDH7447437.1 hypothetical protein [Aquimarina sp. 2201CG14-23]